MPARRMNSEEMRSTRSSLLGGACRSPASSSRETLTRSRTTSVQHPDPLRIDASCRAALPINRTSTATSVVSSGASRKPPRRHRCGRGRDGRGGVRRRDVFHCGELGHTPSLRPIRCTERWCVSCASRCHRAAQRVASVSTAQLGSAALGGGEQPAHPLRGARVARRLPRNTAVRACRRAALLGSQPKCLV